MIHKSGCCDAPSLSVYIIWRHPQNGCSGSADIDDDWCSTRRISDGIYLVRK